MTGLTQALDPRRYATVLGELARSLTRNRVLIWELTRRELRERYVGQALGLIWSIGHPLLLMAVYILMFVYVFKLRGIESVDNARDYTVYVLSGLVPWLAIVEVLNRSTASIVANAGFVKQIVFPVEVLPVRAVTAALLGQGVGTVVLFGYIVATSGTPPTTALLWPAIVVLQMALMLGVSYVLAATAVFFRDIKDFVLLFSTIGLFCSPILFPVEMFPDSVRFLPYLNPVSYPVWVYQDALFHGDITRPVAWIVLGVMTVVSLSLGYRYFRFLRPMFGDVL